MTRWFSPALLPYVDHPLVVALGPLARGELLRRALVRELVRHRLLVATIVAPLARQLASEDGFSRGAKRGHRLARDKEWHAAMIDGLMASLQLADDGAPPAFAVRLDTLLRVHARDDDEALLLTLLFVVIAETSGPQARVTLASDPTLHPDVREFILGRGMEEKWHARYFTHRMRELWAQLSRRQLERLGPMLPALVQAWLNPDRAAVLSDLHRVGLSPDQAVAVLAEAWPLERSEEDLRGFVGPTLAALEEAGVLAHPSTLVAFVEAGLMVG